MRKHLLILVALLLITACGTSAEEKAIEEERNNFKIHENIDNLLGVDALTTVWKMQDDFTKKEEADTDSLFRFTDTYLMEDYESLNEQEQAIVMKTSGMISKFLDERYKGIEDFNEDKDEFYKVLETGIY